MVRIYIGYLPNASLTHYSCAILLGTSKNIILQVLCKMIPKTSWRRHQTQIRVKHIYYVLNHLQSTFFMFLSACFSMNWWQLQVIRMFYANYTPSFYLWFLTVTHHELTLFSPLWKYLFFGGIIVTACSVYTTNII